MPGRPFHKPTRFEPHRFEAYLGGEDPARTRAVAHESARALVDHGHRSGAEVTVDRLLEFADAHGIDTLAELWAQTAADSLPGALWRLHLLRAFIREGGGEVAAGAFRRGVARLRTADQAIAGVPEGAGPSEVLALADTILRGAYRGDLGDALDRAAACCRILAAGTLDDADASDVGDAARASRLTTRAARLATIGAELHVCARRERAGTLD
ncbi:MAG TPA: DNA-directed RNA polymerase subunit beta [Microbacteriaceae bacterium]|nr:DNA-directed RNA polymerase subunit beta [Microbacteriaceae bacterium]